MKYIIVPKEYIAECVDAECPDDAMAMFAAQMDSDMNTYFRAVADPREEDKTKA